jgi:hypothetical protein
MFPFAIASSPKFGGIMIWLLSRFNPAQNPRHDDKKKESDQEDDGGL